jgi:hypothetical protein
MSLGRAREISFGDPKIIAPGADEEARSGLPVAAGVVYRFHAVTYCEEPSNEVVQKGLLLA